uniref:Protein kinase domain-containing protein n=1 Tax=Oryza punctata TaxID=4537 RepID=A0A0E0JUD4_ORYPU
MASLALRPNPSIFVPLSSCSTSCNQQKHRSLHLGKIHKDALTAETMEIHARENGLMFSVTMQQQVMDISMDFIWNNISGSLPKEVGNITSLELLLLNGNQLNGSLPEEIGFLPNLDRIQIDQEHISGPIPKSFANLNKTKHLLSSSRVIEVTKTTYHLDNNNFSGTSIPSSYGNITKLLKLSLRNCSLEGPVPDISGIPQLGDLSWNQLRGRIPSGRPASNITTTDLSHNLLNGSIPGSFSGLSNLQRLDFQNNSLTNLSNPLSPPANVTILLSGNPICTAPSQLNITRYCQSVPVIVPEGSAINSTVCQPCSTDFPYENIPMSPIPCLCAIPLYVGYRLKSPGFWDFVPYEGLFQQYLSSGLSLSLYQLEISNFTWEEGPRLKMYLKLFPNNTAYFSTSEVLRLRGMFTGWLIGDSDIFGPYELLNFNPGWYNKNRAKSSLSTGAIVGIVVAAFAAAAFLSSLITLIILRRHSRYSSSKKRSDAGQRFVAKVADFGLSRLAPEPETEGTAPGLVSTVYECSGYLDPEYFLTHKMTDKSDVYSLGVVFLELLTGMQPISHGRNIVREVVAANQRGMILSVVDRRIGSYPAECVEKFGALALRCCRDETFARPSMVEVMRE